VTFYFNFHFSTILSLTGVASLLSTFWAFVTFGEATPLSSFTDELLSLSCLLCSFSLSPSLSDSVRFYSSDSFILSYVLLCSVLVGLSWHGVAPLSASGASFAASSFAGGVVTVFICVSDFLGSVFIISFSLDSFCSFSGSDFAVLIGSSVISSFF